MIQLIRGDSGEVLAEFGDELFRVAGARSCELVRQGVPEVRWVRSGVDEPERRYTAESVAQRHFRFQLRCPRCGGWRFPKAAVCRECYRGDGSSKGEENPG